VAERALVEGQEEATAQAATAQAQLATVAAQATRVAAEAVQTTPEVTVPNQPTATPDPAQLALDAQLNSFIREADNMPMLFISGGSYQMGLADGADNPLRPVTVDSFYLDQYEVSVQQFSDFLNRIGGNTAACDGEDCATTAVFTSLTNILNNLGVFDPRPGTERYPATWITWHGANAYCQSVGGRLPTEAEWEYAARGTDGRLYPWGEAAPVLYETSIFNNNTAQSLSIFFSRAFVRVDGLPDSASPFGVQGMSGGAAEWVQDWYDPEFYNSTLPASGYNENDESGLKVLRGGSWVNTADQVNTVMRFALAPGDANTLDLDNSQIGAGFRCASDGN
ncbi:MAG: SUMF1/EgtB/PvdO family nonheme iron enzyme, partial [Chloroflexota bacterium]